MGGWDCGGLEGGVEGCVDNFDHDNLFLLLLGLVPAHASSPKRCKKRLDLAPVGPVWLARNSLDLPLPIIGSLVLCCVGSSCSLSMKARCSC